MSITGHMGRRAGECCEHLLDEGLVHFIASDGHDAAKRPPLLSPAYRAVADGWGEEAAHALTTTNAERVLTDTPVGEGTRW